MKKYKKIFYGSLAFLIPFIILTIVFKINRLFDDNTIIRGDSFAQYYPLFNYLKDVFNGTSSLFYNFYKNLGGTMFGTFFYYLSSPFNIFIKFISINSISSFMAWLIIIKMSLCSLTMYIYMNYKYKKCNIVLLMFSVCYGLMGYNINFFINIMWLDVVIMTPIVLIGLDKIINKESPILYIISLFISILSNYYIAYMLCIFCVIYFIYEVSLKYNEKKEKLKLIKHFILISLYTGLICSFFLIPCIVESRNYLRNLDIKSVFAFNCNIFDIFSKTFIGSIDFKDLLNYSSMNLYCGIIMIPLVYLFLVNKKIPRKQRRLTFLVILFMVLPCFIFPLNYVWHLFSKPSFYSYRYSFLLCFFIINIAYQSYSNLNVNKLKILFYIAIYSIISFYFILITSFGNYYDFLSYKMIWITLGLLFIYILLLKINNKNISKILLCTLLLIENILNVSIIFNNTNQFSKDELEYKQYAELIDKYSDERLELSNVFTGNDSLLMKYYGINNFLSTNNNRVMKFFTQMGYKKEFKNQNIYNYQEEQYILDSIIGLKYIISPDKMNNYKLIEHISNDKEYYIYENPNSLGFGYIIKNECNDIEYDFNYDEKVFNCMFDEKTRYYEEYKIEQNENEYSSIIKNPSKFYLIYPNIIDNDIKFDDELIGYTKNYLAFENSIKNYKFKFSIDNDINAEELKIYYFDYEKFKSHVNKINKERFDYKIIDNKIIGSIDSNGGTLMITIPYEKGFIIKVDGKKVDYKEVLDTFIGIDLSPGYHDISVEYSQPYLKTSICISIISFAFLLVYINLNKKTLLNVRSNV